MKIIQVLELLRLKNIFLEVPEKEDLSVNDKILINCNKKEKLCALILNFFEDTKDIKVDNTYEFEKKLNKEEIENHSKLQNGERDRITRAQNHADNLKLEMNFFASKVSFYNDTYSFFFISENPVDFRELLKLLAAEFKTRIHLQRVGIRDKSKIIGGFGCCGREICCLNCQQKLESVPMDAARDQGLLVKENDKLLGLCGKLKCCLMYELPFYKELRKNLPHIKQNITLKNGGKGRVIGLDILNQKVKVVLADSETIEKIDVSEIQEFSSKK